MPNENYEGFDLTIYNLFTLLREMYYTRGETETNFLAKSGGTLGGSLTIQGNLTVQGNSYKIDTEDLVVKDYTITLAKDNNSALLSMVGMVVPKYDGTNYGFFGWDADGYAYVGDLTDYDGTSNITLANNSSLQKIATIKDTATGTTSDDIMVYDQTNKVFKKAPSGRYVIEDNELVASNDNNALYNLGAFDVYPYNNDNSKVQRRTRYVVIKGDTFNWSSDNPYSNFYGIFYSNALPDIVAPADGYEIPKMSARGWNVYAREDVINHNQGITIQPSGNYLMIRDTSCSTKADLIAKLNANPIYIEYQSTTYDYIEDIIPNQPLLNLDQTGCNFLRNEWEKGLNLCALEGFSASGGITKNGYTISVPSGLSIAWYGVLFQITLPAGTYTMKLNSSVSSGHVGRIQINDSASGEDLGNLYVEKTIEGARGYFNDKSTFTLTQTTTLYARYCMDCDYSGNQIYSPNTSIAQTFTIMLNEGNHPYPYEAYNGAIVRYGAIHTITETRTFTADTSFAYTGEYLTIPANCIFSITVSATYNATKPIEVSINSANNSAYQKAVGYCQEDMVIASATYSGITDSSDKNYYFFTKYNSAGSNELIISGWYMKIK